MSNLRVVITIVTYAFWHLPNLVLKWPDFEIANGCMSLNKAFYEASHWVCYLLGTYI